MKVHSLIFVACITVSNCKQGGSSGNGAVSAAGLGLSHPAGTYDYYPWVVLSWDESFYLGAKGPGESDFSARGCQFPPYKSGTLPESAECREITEDGTLMWEADDSNLVRLGEGAIDYKVSLEPSVFSISDRDQIGASANSNFNLDKVLTYCSFRNEPELRVTIHLKNDEKIGPTNSAVIHFGVVDPEREITVIDQQNTEKEVLLDVRPDSDGFPPTYRVLSSYTTDQSSNDASSCEIEVTAFERGKEIRGKINCTNLDPYDGGQAKDDEKTLGRHLDLSGEWTCEKYKYM